MTRLILITQFDLRSCEGALRLCQVSVAQSLGLERLGFVKHSTRSSQPTGEGVKTGKASGVQVADEVCRIFYDMKVRKCSTPEEIKKRKKAVIFCLSADKKCIVVEEGKEILVGDVGETITDPFKHFVGMLPEKDCRYALYDASFETKESRKEELMFFLWAPEHAPLKSKMIYASSKDAIKKKFQGIKHEYQANGPEDLNRTSIAEKLGGSLIVAFEGSPI
ncbi:hypothetical protein ACRRTK_013585 [Alexandromys fortis]